MPLSFGANQSGMQATKDLPSGKQKLSARLWKAAAKVACCFHYGLEKVGVHKQLCNRILEPWMQMRLVVTGTEWANFLWLRDHKDAQPEFQLLARKVYEALSTSTPTRLEYGEWHLPFVTEYDRKTLSLDDQKKLSVSCCAQFSFRALDRSIKKAYKLDKMLKDGDRLHASPFEHQAQCVSGRVPSIAKWQALPLLSGMTHEDRKGYLWSGNLKGWMQHRQLIWGHNMDNMATYENYLDEAA